MTETVDLLVIGGGINGTGIARDAAGRGLSVILCEKDDLSEGTSSRSGKLVHGGLRYLEYYEFRLVREALIEREVLLESAPHIIWPMRFVLPHSPDDRPAWLIRLGLFLYDHLGGRKRLPGTRKLDLRCDPEGAPLKDSYTTGFEYSDCWVDDARLVVVNAVDAAGKGAQILTRTACTRARPGDGLWQIEMTDTRNGTRRQVMARALVNAGGPWVNDIIGRVTGTDSRRNVRLVKGSHIIVPRFWEGAHAYLVQNSDKRVIFVNPYEGDKALIGTTDIPYDGAPEAVSTDESEIDYLIGAVNRYFKQSLRRADVIESFSGVRPLYDDGAGNPSAVTRDYVLDLDSAGGAPLLNVFGGKITTFRKLAEQALHKLSATFPNMGPDWTARAKLPGGGIEAADMPRFLDKLAQIYPWMPRALIRHYARVYGACTASLVGGAQDMAGLGRHFGGQLYEVEVRYLTTHEWAETAEDILWRRTKHRLHMTAQEQAAFAQWFEAQAPHAGMKMDAMAPVQDMSALMRFSARIGADPLLIQAAGGNTSVKDGGAMWIKASGTLLAEAETRDTFVPCDLEAMRASVAAGEARADSPAEFSLLDGGLRPSIETALHAVYSQRVVVHVHCVNTLALAVRKDARAVLAQRLAAFDWAFVPYVKPGAQLAGLVRAALGPKTNVVVLGNHGLIVAADSVAEAEALLGHVVGALSVVPAEAPAPKMERLAQVARGSAFAPLPADHPLHGVALMPHRLAAATGGSLYPDHVIFCGIGAAALTGGETPEVAARRHCATQGTDPVFLLVPGAGALLRSDASSGAQALVRCLGDVLARLPDGVSVNHLTQAGNAALLNWDAEKYRQALNAT